MGNTFARLSGDLQGGQIARVSSRTEVASNVPSSLSSSLAAPFQQAIRDSLANINPSQRTRIALVIEIYQTNSANATTSQEENTSSADQNESTTTSTSESTQPAPGISLPRNFVFPQIISAPSSSTTAAGESASTTPNPNIASGARPIRRILVLLGEDVADRVINGNAERELNNILNYIFHQAEFRGTPPASKDIVEALPLITITKEMKEINDRCSVCCEDFIEGKEAIQLPCHHIFDKECIDPWLKDHCSCPVCRYELPVDDPEYETSRKARMAARSIEDPQRPSAPSAQSTDVASEPVMEVEPTITPTPEEIEQEPQVEESRDAQMEDSNANDSEIPEESVEESTTTESENQTEHRTSIRDVQFAGREKRREKSSYLSKIRRWFLANRKRKE